VSRLSDNSRHATMLVVPSLHFVCRKHPAPDRAQLLQNPFVATKRGDISMAMNIDDIQAGKCYVSGDREKFTVLDVNRGIVTYKSWTNDPTKLFLRINTGINAFSPAVVKEIECPPTA
jgi:hypothetical protein